MYRVKNCGVKFDPPLLLVTYIDNSSKKKRCRKIPVRKLKENTNVSRIAEDLKATQRHRTLLSSIPQAQIERLLMMVQGHMKGQSIEESLVAAKKKLYVDPEKNLNTLNDDEVRTEFENEIPFIFPNFVHQIERAKLIMDESFESRKIGPDDPRFQYDIEVRTHTCGSSEMLDLHVLITKVDFGNTEDNKCDWDSDDET